MTDETTAPMMPLPITWQVPTLPGPDGPEVNVRDVIAAAANAVGRTIDPLRAAYVDARPDALVFGEPPLSALAAQAVDALDALLDAIDEEYPAPAPADVF